MAAKQNNYVELEEQIWFQLSDLALEPGMSCYYQGIRITKTKGFSGFNLAAKYKRNYKGKGSKEPWYILTNLDNLSDATDAYAKRMGIEEAMQRGLVGFQQRATASRQCLEILNWVAIIWKSLNSAIAV